MYTSGCPNSQNRCCQSSGSPPRAGSKNGKPNARSTSSRMLPSTSGGKPTTIMKATTSRYHAKSGIRLSDMPAVRTLRMLATISTPAQRADTSTKVTPSSQTSELMPEVKGFPDSGVYMNQPAFGAKPRKSEVSRISPPNR